MKRFIKIGEGKLIAENKPWRVPSEIDWTKKMEYAFANPKILNRKVEIFVRLKK